MKTMVRLDDVELAVTVRGKGRPLLFVHGFPLSRRMWDAQVDAFAATHQVIAPDLRGFGESGVNDKPQTMESYADDLADVLNALGISQRVVLCGLSMGGYIAFAFCHKYASRLAGLVLADTRAIGDSEQAAKDRVAMAERVLAEGPMPVVEGMVGKLFGPQTYASKPELVESVRQMMLGSSPVGMSAAMRAMAVRRNWTGELKNMTTPALVVVGSGDVISPPAEMREIAEGLPHCEYVELTTAGHMSPMEEPAGFNRALAAFCDRL
ncbi:MAG: alpha/beta fold hydrolase [Phycisphaerales bacterium]|nr:alpha/beta fold hydrolase [Phycisphaerales bacterium]